MIGTIKDTVFTVVDIIKQIKRMGDNPLESLTDRSGKSIVRTKGNIIELIGQTTIRPKIVITNDLKNHEKIHDVINMNTDLFMSIYKQAFVTIVDYHGLSVNTALDLLSSNYGNATAGTEKIATQSLQELDKWSVVISEAGLESDKGRKSNIVDKMIREFEVRLNVSRRTNEDKVSEDAVIKINFLVIPKIVYVPTQELVTLMEVKGDTTKLSSAWHSLRSGADTFKDFVFADKLISAYKDGRLKEQYDTILDTNSREYSSLHKLSTSGAIGFNRLYQMIITSPTVRGQLNALNRGNIEKDKNKDKLLETLLSLSISVIDDNYDLVSVYLNSSPGVQEVPLKKLSGNNSDLDNLFKLLTTQRGI